MSGRIYGPGHIKHRKAVCPTCHREFSYYGQNRGRRRCNDCRGEQMVQQIWIRVWKRFGEAISPPPES